MLYTDLFASPLGEILLVSDGEALCGLYFEGQKYVPALPEAEKDPSLPVFKSARAWLERYFAGEKPEVDLPLCAGETCGAAGETLLGAGGRRGGRAQPDLSHRAVPPCDRRGRLAYRLCRRPCAQARAAAA